eukprot:scaffold112794_cov30-Prasinocladus_malaysianus.AAC.1
MPMPSNSQMFIMIHDNRTKLADSNENDSHDLVIEVVVKANEKKPIAVPPALSGLHRSHLVQGRGLKHLGSKITHAPEGLLSGVVNHTGLRQQPHHRKEAPGGQAQYVNFTEGGEGLAEVTALPECAGEAVADEEKDKQFHAEGHNGQVQKPIGAVGEAGGGAAHQHDPIGSQDLQQ